VGADAVNLLNAILLLLTAFVAVFAQSAFVFTRPLLGAQVDLLPPLVVYASLTGELTMVALLAVWGGLCFDSLSANPLGISVLPLFAVGLAIQRKRGLILRGQFTAQFVLGTLAGAGVPVLTALLLLSAGQRPLLGWGSLWQLAVMSLGAGILTPAVFCFFDLLIRAFAYRPASQISFRPDREVRRGRF
jgi:cell shape-determining protein MreD